MQNVGAKKGVNNLKMEATRLKNPGEPINFTVKRGKFNNDYFRRERRHP